MENPKIKKIINLGENIRVAELENGFSVAYENKGIGEKVCGECGHKHKSQEAAYAILKGRHSYSCCEISTGRSVSFSKEAKEKVDNYLSSLESGNTVDSLESRIPELYEEATKPLDIKGCRHRDWDEIKFWGKATLYWPISMYYAFIYRNKEYNNDGLLGAVLAPFFMPYILMKLAWPTKKAKKITNRNAVTKYGQDAAVIFCGEYVGEKANLGKFNSLNIIFEDGLMLSGKHLFKSDYEKENYREAKHFINLDDSLKKRIYDTFEAIELEDEKYYSAYEETNNADHSALMKECYKD